MPSKKKQQRIYKEVPRLLLGFDTETTGLEVTTERAISYGFCAYQYGVPIWQEQVFVLPDREIAPGAAKVHGLSIERLNEMAASGEQKVLTVEGGLAYALSILQHWHEQGAEIIGANVVRFDLEMLRQSTQSKLGKSVVEAGLAIDDLRIIDVISHDRSIDTDSATRPRRGLSYLCEHYGVKQGRHDALGDAVATVEVFLEQIIRVNKGRMSFGILSDSEIASFSN